MTMDLYALTRAGQPLAAQALNGTQAEQQQRLTDRFGAAFREITPALILTGIAIGIASGLGSTIGTALGTIVVDRVVRPRQTQRRRR